MNRYDRSSRGIEKQCKNCGELTMNIKFCSHPCRNEYDKKHKLNMFNSSIQSERGKVGGTQTHKLHPNMASELGKKNIIKSLETSKRNKKGFWNSETQRENGRRGVVAQRREKIGPFFNEKMHLAIVKEAGKIGGKRVHELHPNLARDWGRRSAKMLRERRNMKFDGIFFASFGECEIGMCIHYQFNIKLKKRENVHFMVDGKEIDFFVDDCFIEYHPYNTLYSKYDFDLKEYYSERRAVLNKNGYEEYPLVLIK